MSQNPFSDFDDDVNAGISMSDINLDPQQAFPTLQFEEENTIFGDVNGDMMDLNAVETSDTASLLESGKTEVVQPTGMCSCFSVAYYQPFFNVSTLNVVERLSLTVKAFKPDSRTFFSVIEENPDLYGPFWLSTSLIFMIAATSNFSSWLSFVKTTTNPYWTYDFNLAVIATSLVYGFTFGAPVLLWFVCKYLQISLKLINAICLYGYSLGVFIPTAVLCAIPSHLLDWAVMMAALSISCSFVGFNIWPLLCTHADLQKRYAVLASVLGAHCMFGMILKVYFFQHSSIPA